VAPCRRQVPEPIGTPGELKRRLRSNKAGGFHGFLLDHWRYTSFDVPGAPNTLPFDINNRGQVVGIAGLSGRDVHGFLFARGVGGPATTVDVPGAAMTFAFGLNDHDQIVGTYTTIASAAATLPGPQGSPR
jgi:probable HAF family extracellular repeat protein